MCFYKRYKEIKDNNKILYKYLYHIVNRIIYLYNDKESRKGLDEELIRLADLASMKIRLDIPDFSQMNEEQVNDFIEF